MDLVRTIMRHDVAVVGSLGMLTVLVAMVTGAWQNPIFLVVLTGLLIAVDLFPVRIGKVNFSFSFPIVYTIAIVTGFRVALVLSCLVLIALNLLRKKPRRAIIFNTANRALALATAGGSVHLIAVLDLPTPSLTYYLLHLIVASVTYTGVSILLLFWHLANRTKYEEDSVRTILRMALFNVLMSFCYDGFMLWLAADPKNTGSGDLGTFFFYLPLVGFSLVMHLITNLTRAKSRLETLFTISQSIMQQHDLTLVLTQIIHEATRLIHGSCGLLYLVQEDGNLLQAVTSQTLASGPPVCLPRYAGLVGAVTRSGEMLLVHDVSRDGRLHPLETQADTRSLLLVPILIDGTVIGVMSFGRKETYSFQADELKLMTIFATHAKTALKNASYIEERERRLLVEERNRLAREMHDGLAQDLASSILKIEMILRDSGPHQDDALLELRERLRKTVVTVRQSIYSLRPAPYSQIGLIPTMRSQLSEVEEQHGLRTELVAETSGGVLPTEIAKAVYQIFNESVQNTVKHAAANTLFVRLERDASHLCLTVRDDGCGFDFAQVIRQAVQRHSFGIENLHNIADEIGGTLEVITAPGRGTEIHVEIPLKEVEAHDHSRLAM